MSFGWYLRRNISTSWGNEFTKVRMETMNVLGTGPLGKVPFFPIEVEVADVGFGGDGGEVSKREELELGQQLV